MELAAKAFKVKHGFMVLPKWMIRLAGLFNQNIEESIEMLYQSKFDYQFDSSKFEKAFGIIPVTYQAGIKATVESLKNKI